MALYKFALGLLLTSLFTLPAVAQSFVLVDGSARNVALSHAGVALPQSWDAVNPASIALFDRPLVAFASGRAFGMAELTPVTAGGVLPTRYATVAPHISTFGYDAFRQSTFSLQAARGFSPATNRQIYFGVRAGYHHLAQDAPYGNAQTVSVSLGALAPITQNLMLGAAATNLNAPAFRGGYQLGQEFAIGLSYTLGENVLLLSSLNKDLDFPLSLRGGLEWHPVDVFTLRLGTATEPDTLSAGAGFHLSPLRIDLAAIHHRDLGWSPAASLQIDL